MTADQQSEPNEFGTGPSSALSSPSTHSAPFWRQPQALAAVASATWLRYTDRLAEDWTAYVLLGAAIGTAAVKALERVFEWRDRRRARG